MQKALGHLRRYRAIAQRARNAALEADACRRLSSMYAEIARPASLPGGTADAGDGDENPAVSVADPPPESHVRVLFYIAVLHIYSVLMGKVPKSQFPSAVTLQPCVPVRQIVVGLREVCEMPHAH